MEYKAVIGIEIHAQLLTKAKFFVPEAAVYGEDPNTFVSTVTLAHPGTLPTINKKAVEYAVKMGLATHCKINKVNYFARKNYFYADLPKGYQISQFHGPICHDGFVEINLENGETKKIGLTRIHMEEDSGKSLHDQDINDTLVDFNRAGTGLIEIVTEPDMETPEEAGAYVAEVRKILRYIEVCDGNMEEGSLRCDANVSVMKKTDTEFGTKVEVKNMNSISNIVKAIQYEIDRQIELVESGGQVKQQTMTWDPVNGKTILLREKESSDDYRYFPEPDLLPVILTDEQIHSILAELPALPRELYEKFTKEYELPVFDTTVITEDKKIAEFYLSILEHTNEYKTASNWVLGPVKSYLNENALTIDQFPLNGAQIAEIMQTVDDGKVSLSIAKEKIFFDLMQNPEKSVLDLAAENGYILETDTSELETMITELLEKSPKQVETYRAGKTGLLGFFVGQIMKQSKGKFDPKTVKELIAKALDA